MDTDEYPSLPNLSQIHSRLASNSRRVEAAIDSQFDGIERLFSATTAEDWEAVAKATKYLANLEPDQIDSRVIRSARRLSQEIGSAASSVKRPKHLASLLEACRAVRKKGLQWNGQE